MKALRSSAFCSSAIDIAPVHLMEVKKLRICTPSPQASLRYSSVNLVLLSGKVGNTEFDFIYLFFCNCCSDGHPGWAYGVFVFVKITARCTKIAIFSYRKLTWSKKFQLREVSIGGSC